MIILIIALMIIMIIAVFQTARKLTLLAQVETSIPLSQ